MNIEPYRGDVLYSFSYDGVGNFKDNPTLGAANSVNEYSNISYNPRHDLTNDGVEPYGYDALDRLTSVTPDAPASGSLAADYGYDGKGRMAWEDVYTWAGSWVFSTTYHFAWNGDELVAKLDANNNILQQYTWGPGQNGTDQVVALTNYTSGGPQTYALVYDASGNVTMMVDPLNGSVVASYSYAPYGALVNATGPEAGINPFGFKGYWTDYAVNPNVAFAQPDAADGTVRETEVQLGIWLEDDPTGIDGGLNPVSVDGNDPINNADPNGTRFESIKAAFKKIGSILDNPAQAGAEAGVEAARWLVGNSDSIKSSVVSAALRPRDFQTGEAVGGVNAAVKAVTGPMKMIGQAQAFGDTLVPQVLDALSGAPDRNESAYAGWAQADSGARAVQLPDQLRQRAFDQSVNFFVSTGSDRQALKAGAVSGEVEFTVGSIVLSFVDPAMIAGDVGAVADTSIMMELPQLESFTSGALESAPSFIGPSAASVEDPVFTAFRPLAEAGNDSAREVGLFSSPAHPTLPLYSGGPTQGTFVVGETQVFLRSGVEGPAQFLPYGNGFTVYTASHVEGHAAALMEQYGIENAELYLNFPGGPCARGCDLNLDSMVPPGSTLKVFFPTESGGVDCVPYTNFLNR